MSPEASCTGAAPAVAEAERRTGTAAAGEVRTNGAATDGRSPTTAGPGALVGAEVPEASRCTGTLLEGGAAATEELGVPLSCCLSRRGIDGPSGMDR
jgi:hypothetical protein